MESWNVVVTVHEGGFRDVRALLKKFGPVWRTEFFNVLVLRTSDIYSFMESMREQVLESPGILNSLNRLVPVTHTVDFQTPEEFETKAKEVVLSLAPSLAKKTFHIRMRRRGFKGRLSSMEVERMLDEVLLERLEILGTPGRISFDDPDAVVSIETIGQSAGFGIWTREDMARYPFLKI